MVLRAFEDDDVDRAQTIRIEHLRVVEIELALADLETIEKRLNQATRQAKLDKSAAGELEIEALQAAYDALNGGSAALPRRPQARMARAILKPYFLLTNRSVLAVVNVGENDLDRIPEVEQRRYATSSQSAGDNVEVIGMCVQLEAEAATIVDPRRAGRDA